jgi:hypothetical protein
MSERRTTMTTLHTLPAPALPPGRQWLVLLLLATAGALGRLAARMARRTQPTVTAEREVAALPRAGGGRAAAVYEDGRLVGVLEGVDRL